MTETGRSIRPLTMVNDASPRALCSGVVVSTGVASGGAVYRDLT